MPDNDSRILRKTRDVSTRARVESGRLSCLTRRRMSAGKPEPTHCIAAGVIARHHGGRVSHDTYQRGFDARLA